MNRNVYFCKNCDEIDLLLILQGMEHCACLPFSYFGILKEVLKSSSIVQMEKQCDS